MDDFGRSDQKKNRFSSLSQNVRRKDDFIHLKVLVPSIAVGAIIGKGGESIAKIQKETGVRIKLSKVNDFYPGTEERVCHIQGTLEGVKRMHNYIMNCILEKPELSDTCAVTSSSIVGTTAAESGLAVVASPSTSTNNGGSSTILTTSSTGCTNASSGPKTTSSNGLQMVTTGWKSDSSAHRLPWGRHKQVKILVPNCTAGLVIGKLGSYVREIKDRTGAFIQISQKSIEVNLLERCIIIAGEPDQCRAAVDLVLAKIAEDPQSGIYPTISYSHVRGPVASAYPTGSPFAVIPTFRFSQPLIDPRMHFMRQPTAPTPSGSAPAPQFTAPLLNPWDANSPMFQAALLQATVMASNFQQPDPHYYSGPGPLTAPASGDFGRLMAHQPQHGPPHHPHHHHHHQPQQQQQQQQVLGPSGSNYAGPSANVHLMPALVDSIQHGTTDWQFGADTSSQLTTPPVAFETGYPGSLNFAIFAANQPTLLNSMSSRNPTDAYTSPPRLDLYSPTSPYAPQSNFAIPSASFVSTGSATTGQLPPAPNPIYANYLHLSTVMDSTHMCPGCFGPDPHIKPLTSVSQTVSQTPAVVTQLNELFQSMRLEDSAGSDMMMTHQGILNVAAPTVGPYPTRYISSSIQQPSIHGQFKPTTGEEMNQTFESRLYEILADSGQNGSASYVPFHHHQQPPSTANNNLLPETESCKKTLNLLETPDNSIESAVGSGGGTTNVDVADSKSIITTTTTNNGVG